MEIGRILSTNGSNNMVARRHNIRHVRSEQKKMWTKAQMADMFTGSAGKQWSKARKTEKKGKN
jgi:hypothetical protein